MGGKFDLLGVELDLLELFMARKLSLADWAAKRFEANQLFTPSTPIKAADLFAGRQDQMFRIVDAVGERGRHVILYGERGVGKTSLSQITPYLIPTDPNRIRFFRVQCFPTDDFSSISKKIFNKIRLDFNIEDASVNRNLPQLSNEEVTPDDFIRELSCFNDNYVPIVVIDEFNELKNVDAPILMANTIKALSDEGINVTLVVVGVANNVNELIASHESIERCTEEVLMPRMTTEELRELIEKRLDQLGMTIESKAKWKVINLSKGLPQYVHGLGRQATFEAIKNSRLDITDQDSDIAIENLLIGSDETFKKSYEAATRSNQPGNLFRHVLTACALAKSDESGYFAPVWVRGPLSSITGRTVQISSFQSHLREFTEAKRGSILERIGEERTYRFRFRHPAMQPYIIMRGIREGIVDAQAKKILSLPEQDGSFFES